MTKAQITLLQRLIEADRIYRSKREYGILTENDERGVEIGWINTVDPRTAAPLVEHGLAEIVDTRLFRPYIFLGKYCPYDDV